MSAAASILLRPGSPADFAQIQRIENVCFSDPWPRSALLSELHADRMRYALVAERQGRVIGYLMAWRIVDQLHVLNLAVDPVEQRQGVATRLIHEAFAEARERGLREITLEVRLSNVAAQGFYLRHGFARTGLRPGYYRDTGEDALIMTRAVPPAHS